MGALDCPKAAGDVELHLDIKALAATEQINGLVNIQLDVAADNGDKLLCAALTTTQADAAGASSGCVDVPPDSQYTCAQQKAWGKCGESFMKGHCCQTCHGCQAGCGNLLAEETTV